MKVIFNNLGPIKKGEIDLSKRFYLFVGQNNSGKTYTSNLLWCIFNPKTISSFTEDSNMVLPIEGNKLVLTEEFISELLEKYANHIKNIALPNVFNVTNNHFIFEKIQINFTHSLKNIIGTSRSRNIEVKYDANVNVLFEVSKDKDSFEIVFRRTKGVEEKLAKHHLQNGIKKGGINIETEQLLGLENELLEDGLNLFHSMLDNQMKQFVCYFLFDLLFNHLQYNLISLPSERKSYTTFNSHFFRLEKEKKSEMEKRLLKIVSNGKNGNQTKEIEELLADTGSEYTEVMDNLLTKFYKLSEEKPKEITDYQDCVEDLLQIMQGNVVMESKTANPKLAFSIQDSKENLGMYLASSSVNQLSALLYFFRYWAAKEANFLMMDEPEENLSPSNQTKLIDVLYKYVATNNNRLLLTTHSPLIAKCINNYLHLGFLKEKGLIEKVIENEKLSLEPEKVLNAVDFGVYFFDGERVIDYVEKEGNEYGVFFREFEKAVTKVNNFSDTLKNYIYDFIEENG